MINKKKVIKYVLLPGILPRITGLLGSGFSHMASLVAVLYKNAGLLPSGHPYLKPQNFGKFGVRHVIAEASGNLVLSRKNMDQVIIHYTIIAGVVLLLMQLMLMALSVFSLPAFAGVWTNTFINTPFGPDQDIAFYVLDRVFGIMNFQGTAGFFGSCYSTAVICTDINGNPTVTPAGFPSPFHQALHQMFRFYTLGIAFLSLVVIIYFIIAIIGETIASGRPFGTRFNKAWFIPRLIVFFILIAPMNMGPGGQNVGINAAQFITLGAAQFGSNMATNAWDTFHTNAIVNANVDTYLGDADTLIAIPNAPEMGTLTQFLFVARMCILAEKIMHNRKIGVYIVRNNDPGLPDNLFDGGVGFPYLAGSNNNAMDFFTASFDDAVRFSRYGKVTVRFGHFNPPGGAVGDPNNPPDAYDQDWGYVKPTCGELTFIPSATQPDQQLGDPVLTGFDTANGNFVINPRQPGLPIGPYGIQELYYLRMDEYLRQDLFFDEVADCMLKAILPYDQDSSCVDLSLTNDNTAAGVYPNTRWAHNKVVNDNNIYYNNLNKAAITGLWNEVDPAQHNSGLLGGLPPGWTGGGANNLTPPDPNNFIDQMRLRYDFRVPPLILERGWVGASLWYNQIANINGMFMSAVQNVPKPTKYPEIMEIIASQRKKLETNSSWKDRFNPMLKNGKLVDLPRPGDQYIAAALYSGYSLWGKDDVTSSVRTRKSGNGVIDVINMIFGTEGLYDILESDRNGVHPLALLSSLGKGIVDASLRNLMIGVVGQGIGEVLSDNFVGSLGKVASGVAVKFALMGLSIGFVLYYVLPLLPFIYFFFAFGGWIKSIFEAMVAMPLWALAHIKIDGEGLPGPWATNGYFLLFEIFLRPTLIIFGFLASISLFSALVNALHDSFYLVVFNATGFDLEEHLFSGAASLPVSNPVGLQSSINFIRGPVDEFFYTLIYTIIVYMIGMSTFKMIDQVPNNILRWMGVTVSAFHEYAGDPAGQLSGRVFRSGQIMGSQLQQMVGYLRGTGGSAKATTDTVIQTSMLNSGK